MKRKSQVLFLTAVALILTSFIHSASAYFTTYAEARGGYTVRLEGERHIDEEFYDWTKHVRIESTGTVDCYVRVRAIAPTGYDLIYSGENWTAGGDGWYYYRPILTGGGITDELLVRIENIPESVAHGDNFDVVVVYESAPVQYGADGSPLSAVECFRAMKGGGLS